MSERPFAPAAPGGIVRFLACAQQAVQTRNVVRSPCTNNQSAPPHVFPSLLPSSAPSTCVVAKQITTLVAVWTQKRRMPGQHQGRELAKTSCGSRDFPLVLCECGSADDARITRRPVAARRNRPDRFPGPPVRSGTQRSGRTRPCRCTPRRRSAPPWARFHLARAPRLRFARPAGYLCSSDQCARRNASLFIALSVVECDTRDRVAVPSRTGNVNQTSPCQRLGDHPEHLKAYECIAPFAFNTK